MVMVMGFGTILMTASIIFAVYGVLYWLFGGGQPVSAAPSHARRSGAPNWLTPVVLVGLVISGSRSGMPFWLVALGSVFAVVMLVKLNVLSFTGEPQPSPPTPPPLPREPRFQNATHHPGLSPAPRRKSGFGVFASILTAAVVIGFTMFSVVVMREDRLEPPRRIEMVAAEEWSGAVQEARAEIQQGMHEMTREIQAGTREIANAAKETTRVFRTPPAQAPAAATTPPRVAPPSASPTIPATPPERIDRVPGRNGVVMMQTSKKPKRAPKPSAPPALREPGLRVDYNLSPQELAEWGTDKSPNGVYVLLTDPKDVLDDHQAAFQRAVALMKNHLIAKHDGVALDSFNVPSFAWCEANGLIHKRQEDVGGVTVQALGTNFSPKAMDLAYNYHLGCERTREAAKGYFGGLFVLGGLGLLLRIGTGIRPTAPVPST